MRKLDGTKDFITEIPEFTVSVALVEQGQPILGVIQYFLIVPELLIDAK